MEDPDRIFPEGGAIEAMRAAQQAGQNSLHRVYRTQGSPGAFADAKNRGASRKFRFDAVQMPLNVMDGHFRSFEHQVLPLLLKDEVGVLGMKALGDPFILRSNTVAPIECLHYAMNLPGSTVISRSTRPRSSSKHFTQPAHLPH